MIKLVVTDVDGTLVQPDKSLSPGTIAAAARLQAAGVKLAVVSARPPRGMAWISEALKLQAPYAGFNGGMMIGPGGDTVEWNPCPVDQVTQALDLFAARGVDAWLFTQDEWLVRDGNGVYVEHEHHTVRFAARVVDDFSPYVDQVGKLCGVSDDFDKLASVEKELQALVGDRATANRSQKYYLDLTHKNANKGYAVGALARHLGFEPSEVAVLGDMNNDIPMFRVAGFSVAMGNGSVDAKAAATTTTAANDHEGWATAIDSLILPRSTP
jgi:Cof subfamily protein (haloacid dehalogenase superfamily)